MKVGIISNKSHAKSHAAALRKKGHDVVMLGGNPKQIPPTLDALVCRPASISHGGFDSAMAAKKTGMTVILANGVTEVLTAIYELEPHEEEDTTMNEINNSADAMRVLSRLLGVYGSPLHESKAGPVVEQLAHARGENGALGLKLWQKALKTCKRESVRSWAKDQGDKKDPRAKWVYTYPRRGGVRKVCVFVTDGDSLGIMLSRMEIAATEKNAKKLKKSRNPGVRKAEAPGKSAEAGLPVKPSKVGGLPTPASNAELSPPKKSLPVPPPPATPAPAVQANGAWDTQLKSAISLVLAEMKVTNVKVVNIGADGSVAWQRVEVTEGSMQLQPDGSE